MKAGRTSRLPLFFTQVIGSLPRPKVVQDLLARRGDDPRSTIQAIAGRDGSLRHSVTRTGRHRCHQRRRVAAHALHRRVSYPRRWLREVPPLRASGRSQIHRCCGPPHRGAGAGVSVDDARFLVANTDRCTKFALPSPFLIAVRYWHEAHSRDAYPTLQHFIDHLSEILAREALALVEAGIDVVQLDDPALTYFCDRRLVAGEETHDERLRREWNADRQFPEALAAINRITAGLKAEVHLHCCHSVYKRRSDVTGDYKPILPRLATARVDRVNLEFAYPGTGDVGDLALLPAHLAVGMGVVDVRTEQIQTTDAIESLALAGASVVAPQRIALNPDCGFAPGAGERPSIDEAFEKLCRLAEAALRLRSRFANV